MAKTSNYLLELKALVTTIANPSVQNDLLGFFRAEHFSFNQTKEIYERITMLRSLGKEIPGLELLVQDPAISTEAQTALRQAQIGCQTQAIDWVFVLPGDIETLKKSLAYYRKMRALVEGVTNVTTSLQVPGDVDYQSLAVSLEDTIRELKSEEEAPRYMVHFGMGDTSDDLFQNFLANKPRMLAIPTGFEEFDIRAGGFGPTDVVVLASPYNKGKTTMGMSLGLNFYLKACRSACFVSLEMTKEEVFAKVLAALTGIDHETLRKHVLGVEDLDPELKTKATTAWTDFKRWGVINHCRFSIYDFSEGSFLGLINELSPYKYDAIIIDYLSLLVDYEDVDMWKSLAKITREAKLRAKRDHTLMVLLAQMNDDETFRYSRAIGENCDWAWSWFEGQEEESSHLYTVKQHKSRHSEKFPFKVLEDFAHGCFRSYVKPVTTEKPAPTTGDASEENDNSGYYEEGQ